MPAFSNTAAFNEANGFSREYGAWNFEQFQQWLNRMVDSGAIADELRSELIYHARDQINSGFPAPDVIRQIASDVVPGVEDALQRRQGRLNTIQELFQNRQPSSVTMGRIFDNVNGQGEDITRTGEASQREIENTYGRIGEMNDRASGEVVRNIGETTRALQGGTSDTFGRLNRSNTGVTDAVGRANERTTGELRGNASSVYGGLSRENRDVIDRLQGSSDTAFARAGELGRTAYGNTRGLLENTVGGLERGAGDVNRDLTQRSETDFGEMRGNTRDVFSRLGSSAEDAYDESISAAESLDPLGEARQAQVARAFAPSIASAKASLRRRGISSDDAQAQSIIGERERDRARAMDDSAAQFGAENVDRVNSLRLGRQTARERLGTGELDRTTDLRTTQLNNYQQLQQDLRDTMERLGMRRFTEGRDINLAELDTNSRLLLDRELSRQGLSLNQLQNQMQIARQAQQEDSRIAEGGLDRGTANARAGLNTEISLGTGESDRQTDLGQQAGSDYRSELLRRVGTDIDNETSRSAGSQRNLDTTFDRTTDWRNSANQANMLERAMQNEDWEAAANLLREANGEELTAIDVRNLAFSRGQDWIKENLGRRDAGMANLAQIYAREGSQAVNAANTAGNFGQAAQGAYDTTRRNEEGRGNWGTRAITGALTPLIGGSVVGGALGIGQPGIPGAGQPGGAAGPYGAGSTAYGMNWQGTQAPQAAQQNPWAGIYQRFNAFDPRTGAALAGGI